MGRTGRRHRGRIAGARMTGGPVTRGCARTTDADDHCHHLAPHKTAAAILGSAIIAVLVLGGCESRQAADRREAGREFANKICEVSTDDTIITVAVHAFIAQARPEVGRFVYIAGTDSSLPPAGTQAVQDKGPTYMYSPDPAQQAVVVHQLDGVGD